MEVPSPPPGGGGKTYETVEARCAACEIHGGPENPCRSESYLERFSKRTGRICPYVELEHANVLLMDVVGLVLDERLRGLASDHFRDVTRGLDPHERQRLRMRLARSLASAAVTDVLYPEQKKLRERQGRR